MARYPMKILICSDAFPHVASSLRRYLPTDDIIPCPIPAIKSRLPEVDVIIPAMYRIGEEEISITSARMIHQFGVGIEGVDIAAATRSGIYVANVPGSLATGNSDSVAEHAIFLMLALARQYSKAAKMFQTRVWGEPIGLSLRGKTIGILGMGTIGKALSRRLKPFQVRLLAIRRNPEIAIPDDLDLDFVGGPSELEYVLEQSDFLVLALPATQETIGMVGETQLSKIKDGAFVINVGRGAVLDQDALVRALDSGKVAGAGLDVFREEPTDPGDALFGYNVVATPHIAGVTDVSYDEIARALSENIERLRSGLTPANCINMDDLNK